MGAWIALHLALQSQHPISGIVGIGSAINFTYNTFQKLTEDQQTILTKSEEANNSIVNISSPYLEEPHPFTRALYESGNDYLICHEPPTGHVGININNHLELNCPVRFLHGSEDDVVQWSTVKDAMEILQSKYNGMDVTVKLLGGGDHRLSQPGDVSILLETLDDFL